MNAKEISRAGSAVFGSVRPTNWAVRNQQDQEDYGIDYEIELMTPNDQPTGVIFKLQQKAELTLQHNAAQDAVVLHGFPVSKLAYHLEHLDIPVIVVAVDATRREVYWLAVQADPSVEEAYRRATTAHQKTLTLQIPRRNKLPESCDSLLRSVSCSADCILTRMIRRISSVRLVQAAAKSHLFDATVTAVRNHGDVLRLEQLVRLIQDGRYEEARKDSDQMFRSPSESLDLRFNAALHLERVSGSIAARKPHGSGRLEWVRSRVVIRTDLLRVVRNSDAPSNLRNYARLLLRTSRLSLVSEEDFGLYLNTLVERTGPEPLWDSLLRIARNRTILRLLREFDRSQRAFVRLCRKGFVSLLAQAWLDLANDVHTFLLRLRDEGLLDFAGRILEWLDKTREIAVAAARSEGNWMDVVQCAVLHYMIGDTNRTEVERQRWAAAEKLISSIPDLAIRQNGLAHLAELQAHSQLERPQMTTDHEVEIVRQMSAALGIDLDNEQDPISQVVNIGLIDLNPERVLKNCQHLFLAGGPVGVPGRGLGLPSAGMKHIFCLKYKCGRGGISLDRVYQGFYEDHCKNCSSCAPHLSDWKWSREWQEEQNRANAELLAKLNSAPSRMKE